MSKTSLPRWLREARRLGPTFLLVSLLEILEKWILMQRLLQEKLLSRDWQRSRLPLLFSRCLMKKIWCQKKYVDCMRFCWLTRTENIRTGQSSQSCVGEEWLYIDYICFGCVLTERYRKGSNQWSQLSKTPEKYWHFLIFTPQTSNKNCAIYGVLKKRKTD